MAYWLLKTEPTVYSFDDLQREGRTVWNGVANAVALKHLRQAQKGDLALIYHTGTERKAVGLAEILGPAYPDPEEADSKLLVVDLRAVRPLPRPVPLAAVKSDPAFADFALVRQGRLSVVPVPDPLWKKLMKLAGE